MSEKTYCKYCEKDTLNVQYQTGAIPVIKCKECGHWKKNR